MFWVGCARGSHCDRLARLPPLGSGDRLNRIGMACSLESEHSQQDHQCHFRSNEAETDLDPTVSPRPYEEGLCEPLESDPLLATGREPVCRLKQRITVHLASQTGTGM